MSTVIKQRKDSILPPGFDQLGFTIFPDCKSELEIPFVNNRFLTGLDNDPEKKAYFENQLGVKFDTPEGQEFLDNYRIVLSHDVTMLGNTPFNEFDLQLIKANDGFGLIKMDGYEGPSDNHYFEIFDEEKEQVERVTRKSLINRALSEIETLWDGNRPKLVLIAKYLFEISAGITSEIIAYDKLTDYLKEDKTIRNAENAQRVLQALKADPDYVDTVVTVKTAIAKNIIRFTDNWYVNHATQTKLGRNLEDTIAFCNNLQNQDEFGSGTNDAPHTIKGQLKNSLR